MLSVIGYFGIDEVTKIINDIYNNVTYQKIFVDSFFIALPKKQDPNEYERHRTINHVAIKL